MQLADPDTQPQFYAGVPSKRLLAWVIDTVLIGGICILILPFTAFTALFFLPALYLVVGFVYRIITIAGSSATWGMRMMAIEFRAPDGGRLDLGLAFWHTLGYSVSWAVAPLQLVSVILMMVSYRGQGLTDHVLGTVALNRRAS